MNKLDITEATYGSAQWADHNDILRAGMYRKTSDSVFLGFYNRRALYGSGQGGLVSCAAARSGKLSTQIAYNVCGKNAVSRSCLILDPKGEIAEISQNQMFLRKACIYWNPTNFHGLPHVSINILDHIKAGSPTMVSDIKSFYEQWHPSTNFGNAKYFEISAKDIAEAITVCDVELHGSTNIARIYDLVSQLEQKTYEWLNFEFDMSQSTHQFVRRVAAEIKKHNASKNTNNNGGSMPSFLKELYTGFSCLNDPLLRASVSPPFNFSFADICADNAQATNIYLMPPDDLIDVWAPVIKGLLENAYVHKSRHPRAIPQLWIIDECGQLAKNGKFSLIVSLFVIGAGKNIKTWIFVQSLAQLDQLDREGQEQILGSAAFQCYYAINELKTATYLSQGLGKTTIKVPDTLQQLEAKANAKRLGRLILEGDMSVDTLAEYALSKKAAVHQNKQGRDLLQPNEIMTQLSDQMIIRVKDAAKPIRADRVHYFLHPSMVGAYHPNSEHSAGSAPDRVQTPSGILRVITQKVPRKYAHFPQYAQSGEWSFIEGYRP
ncbi:MAG: type IV secretory system conjugative DNA transfer family protein [Rhizobiaceae bacterium]|nr:type IV secretory system conjugative DNA transfer family protein [Rhizobiaceae bacterium]